MSREGDLSMTEHEVRELIATEGHLVLGTLQGDGPPTAAVTPCEVDDGGVTFALPLDSQSAQNLRRDARACAVIENAEHDFYRMRCATVHGSATLVAVDSENQLAHFQLPLDDVVSFDFSRIRRRH
jgi:nitroimidazol reductase NimA-like FMN-containing flavoprotein (pyridoxamine 5'-phosphate oxidase superfamily)